MVNLLFRGLRTLVLLLLLNISAAFAAGDMIIIKDASSFPLALFQRMNISSLSMPGRALTRTVAWRCGKISKYFLWAGRFGGGFSVRCP
ncbi:Uncharacterised protein [Klebsiella michiganensis]|uniref:Uncharacterized protein n=1 Tax=Klebsiella michiganensis TaxID=1134687 RepID=A0A7H4LUL6_9ENTR|nr:Uncharacterised protein [Klebsiella michiganensis]